MDIAVAIEQTITLLLSAEIPDFNNQPFGFKELFHLFKTELSNIDLAVICFYREPIMREFTRFLVIDGNNFDNGSSLKAHAVSVAEI